ncbi:uncharacterized protein LOC144927209 [Branchiostoma floridae x Branchiostoma belcheri]
MNCVSSNYPDVQPSPERQTYWSLTDVDYDGVPFQLVGRIVYACHQGKDKALKQKEKYKAQKEAKAVYYRLLYRQDHNFTPSRRLIQHTKKLNCPAKLTATQVIKFPGFKISENTKALQRQASLALKAELKSSSSTVEGIVEYHARFPSITEHENHPILGEAAELREPVDPEIEKLILKLASDGARKVSEFRRHINTFVKDELLRGQPLPPLTRRRYHPTDKDIRNILSKGKKHTRNSEDDQVNLQVIIYTMRHSLQKYICHIFHNDTYLNLLLAYLQKNVFQSCSNIAILFSYVCYIRSQDDNVLLFLFIHLQTLTTRWATESCCHIKFRASQLQEDGSSTKLLFCYQTHWQQRLLHMYGGQMCLLDATYRTCRYSIPLFFLCVRTNVCYAVVGCFIVQKEETEDIQEALNIFKVWNPDWMPSHFMVDKSNMEINALKAEFPGKGTVITSQKIAVQTKLKYLRSEISCLRQRYILLFPLNPQSPTMRRDNSIVFLNKTTKANVILCDFHREKAWVEWSRKAEHGVRDQQDALLKLLRAIASASTREEYYTRLNELQESDIWKSNVKVQTWISIHWLPEAEKWVQAFRAEHMTVAIYTNNGIERQNETLKYKHLDGYKNCSLTELVTRLVTSFLPETHRNIRMPLLFSFRYIELNVRYSPGYSMYSSTLPNFLKNRPRDMVEHILSRYEDARLHIDPCSIVNKGDGVFQVKSSSQSTYHTISFGTNNTMPSCTCTDWMRYKLPCKHLCAVFQHVPEWGWESFPSKYKDNPIFTLDTKYLGHIPSSDGPDEDDNDAIISTITVDDVQPTRTCSLPARRRSKKVTLRTQCASVIRELTELTYLVHDEEYLELLKTELEDILEDVRAHTPHDGPFALNTTPKKRGVSAHTPHDGPLALNTTLVKREGVSAHTPDDGPLALNTTLVKREGVSAHTPHDGPLAVNTTLVKREGVSAHTPHDGPLALNTTLVKREGVSAHTPHDGPLAVNTTLVKREGVSAHTPHDGPLAVNTTLVKREGVSAHTPHDGPLAVNTTLVKREGVSAHTPHDGPLAVNTTLVKREGVSAHTPHDGPLAVNTTLVKREGVSAHTPHDGPLALNTTLVKRGDSAPDNTMPSPLTTTPSKRTAEMAKLPLYKAPNKNRKNPHTNRVGHWAEVMRRNYRVNNVATEDNLPELTCTVEELIVDDTEETLPEVPQDDEWVTINHTRLTVDDRQLLLTGQWLTDKHINCAQHLLKEEFPLLDGLQDTVVLASGKDLSTCVPVPATAESIQLHHIGDHWVVSCTKEGQTGVTVYDSMYTTVGISLRSQLVRLYKNHASVDEGILPVTVICAQRQVGSGDCGLFAVGNAVALAEGQCPTDIVFEQTKMREHLDKSLAAKSLPMFPVITTFQRSKYFEKSTYQLCVFCTCLQYRQDAPMIQCDQCANWFHYRCVNISARDVAVLVAEQKYSCPACKGK